jgi:RND family efflux transporter MFP subunit
VWANGRSVRRHGIFFALGWLCWACNSQTASLPEVRTAQVTRADLAVRYVAAGHVVSKTLKIGAPSGGRLARLEVRLHQKVKAGQVLFALEAAEAQADLRALEAKLDSARTRAQEDAALLGIRADQHLISVEQALREQREAEFNLLESRRGATLEARQKLREDLRQALESAEKSELEQRRQRELYAQDIVSQVDLETAERTYRLDQSSYRQALADWNEQKKGARQEEIGRLTAKQEYASLGADLARQKAREDELLIHRAQASQAEVRKIEAEIDRQRLLLSRLVVTAPTAGTISQVHLEAGEMAAHQATVVTLVTEGPYWVEADVDEQDASHVKVGQSVQIGLTSLPGKSFAGKISQVAGSLEARPQGPSDHKVLRIHVDFENKPNPLRPGLEADVQGQVELSKGVLSVARGALHREAGQDFVYQVQSGRLNSVKVELGAVAGDRAEIRSGLSEGASVVVEGGDGLPLGSPVQVRP